MFLDVDPRSIGRIGDGKRRASVIDVAMFQSLVRGEAVADLVAGSVNECHHVSGRALSEVRARYVTGLTATAKRRDGQHPIFAARSGAVRRRPQVVVSRLPFRAPVGRQGDGIRADG